MSPIGQSETGAWSVSSVHKAFGMLCHIRTRHAQMGRRLWLITPHEVALKRLSPCDYPCVFWFPETPFWFFIQKSGALISLLGHHACHCALIQGQMLGGFMGKNMRWIDCQLGSTSSSALWSLCSFPLVSSGSTQWIIHCTQRKRRDGRFFFHLFQSRIPSKVWIQILYSSVPRFAIACFFF